MSQITEEDYLDEILRTYAGPPDFKSKMALAALGLAGETGEVIDQVKKHLFHGHEVDLAQMKDELGDVLWYFMLVCQACGFSLADIMSANVAKLRKRYPYSFEVVQSIHLPAAHPEREETDEK